MKEGILSGTYTASDMDWITRQIAVGGLIYDDEAMAEVAAQGVTHILNMSECDDRKLAAPHGIESCWNYVPDDLEPKAPAFFARGVKFAKRALARKNSKLLIHCAAGIHRAPMMTLAVLGSTGWKLKDAQRQIKRRRPCVGFPDVYVKSVRRYLQGVRWVERRGTGRLTDTGTRTRCSGWSR